MGKVIGASNMSLDGNCDHTAMLPNAHILDHYTSLLQGAAGILYGRRTYHLMEYWREFLEKPKGNKAEYAFAQAMDRLPKIVFSRQLKSVDWHTARLADTGLEETVNQFRGSGKKDILIGSVSLIVDLLEMGQLDELQICIHPLLAGRGPRLFQGLGIRRLLQFEGTKSLGGGAMVLYYRLQREQST